MISNLNNLGFERMWFTWSNSRDGNDLIREKNKYPRSKAEHIAWTEPDHCPLVFKTEEIHSSSR